MNIIFQIDGGIGKSISATAVCKAIKKQYPNDKLIVITGYPDVFFCNPNVDKVLNFNNLTYFYADYIDGQEIKMCVHNPYLHSDFINLHGHLNKVWCEMFGITYNGEQPELFITNREYTQYGQQFASPKPILLLQTHGGAPSQNSKYSWARDIPQAVAQKIVDAHTANYNVLHLRRQDQPELKGATPVQADFRALVTLIAISQKRLFMDSFAQHAAAALGMPSVVCWIGNTPVQFGYDIHTNILAAPPTIQPDLRHSVFSRYNISGAPTEFPYRNEDEIFSFDAIMQALSNIKPATTPALLPDVPAAPRPVADTSNYKKGKKQTARA